MKCSLFSPSRYTSISPRAYSGILAYPFHWASWITLMTVSDKLGQTYHRGSSMLESRPLDAKSGWEADRARQSSPLTFGRWIVFCHFRQDETYARLRRGPDHNSNVPDISRRGPRHAEHDFRGAINFGLNESLVLNSDPSHSQVCDHAPSDASHVSP